MNRQEWVKSLDISGIGLELGVAQGDFSNILLSNNKNLYLYLVDAWRYFESGYIDGCNLPNELQILRMATTVAKLRKFEGRYTLIRDLSLNASNIFADNFFDFIYLDSNHSYDSAKEDLSIWYPKLKPGGIFSGHDYVDRPPQFGAKKAVDEFVEANNLTMATTSENTSDGPWLTWYLTKK